MLHKTLQHAQDAVGFASDTTRNLAEVADAALDALDQVTSHTKRGVVGMTNLAAGTVRDMVSETSETARQVALIMARTFLGKSTLNLYLPEMLLNSQIRKRIDRSEIDDIKVQCGNDRFQVEIDGHYHRFLYRLSLDFQYWNAALDKKSSCAYAKWMKVWMCKYVMVEHYRIGRFAVLVE